MKSQINEKFSGNFQNIPLSFIREILNVSDRPNMISFAGGLPNADYFPCNELAVSAQEVICGQGRALLQYAGSQGFLPLREWIARRYNAKYGLQITPENVVITHGSQQTLDITAKMFLNPGDELIVEKPTYLGAIQAMSGYLPRFVEVDLYNDGPDLNQVEKACNEKKPKYMYGIPNFQNPSGICYSRKKREKLAVLLRKYGLLLLEDDPYNEVRFAGIDTPPVFCYAPENVLWSGSFSKMVAPGLRLGWLILPETLTPHFVKAKQSTDLHPNNLSQYILYHYLTHFDIDEHLGKIQKAYKRQCNTMKEMIRRYLPEEIAMTNPEGGMFLWLTLPESMNAEKLAYRCIEKGVAFVPGKSFFTNGEGSNCIRMNFSNTPENLIEKGIRIMGEEMAIQNKKSYSLKIKL